LKKVLISCDSTADFSPELLKKFDILNFPVIVIMDDKPYRDGVDVKSTDIFEYYKRTGKLARTVAPNINDYLTFFGPLVEQGYEIVHFNISTALSGTHNICNMAAAEYDCVYPIDSHSVSTGIALLALRACKLRDEGKTAREIVDAIVGEAGNVDASFTLDTLTYLSKGGRCSSLMAMGANILKLKPCIESVDGALAVGKKYRGKYEDVIISYIKDRLADKSGLDTDVAFITHTCSDNALVQKCVQTAREAGGFEEVYDTAAGPAISVHCGPNTLGVLFMRRK